MQSLIDNASPGAVITITQNYTETSVINVNKPLTIVGRESPSDGDRPVIYINMNINATAVNINASNVTIKGIRFNVSAYNAQGTLAVGSNDAVIGIAPGGSPVYPDGGLMVNENILIDDCQIDYTKFGVSSKAKNFTVTNSLLHNSWPSNTTGRAIAVYSQDGDILIDNNTYTTAGNLAIEGLHMNLATDDSYVNKHSGTITYTNNTSAISTTRKFIFFEVGAEKNPAGADPFSMVLTGNTISAGTGSAFFVMQPDFVDSFDSIGSITIANNTIAGTYANGIVQLDVTYGSAKTHNTLSVTPLFFIYGNTEQTGIVTTGKTVYENVMVLTGWSSLPANMPEILSTSAPASPPPPSDPIVNQVFTTETASTTGLTIANLVGGGGNSTPVTLTKVSDTAANVSVTSGSGATLNRLVLVNSDDINLEKALAVFPNTWRSDINGKSAPISFAVKFVDPTDLMTFAIPSVTQNYTIEIPELANRAYLAIFRENANGTVTFVTNAGLIPGQVSKYTFNLESNSVYTVADSGVLTAGLTTQVVTKFTEMADLFNEDGETHFHGRIYDNADLRSQLKATFNVLYTEVGNLVDAANSATVTIDGSLFVAPGGSEEPGYTEPLTITTNSLVYFVHVLLNEPLDGHDALSAFDASTTTTYEAKNVLREEFIASFKARVAYYFDNLSIVVPNQKVSELLMFYLSPIQKRARMMALAALTGTNTVSTTQINPADDSPQTNTLSLGDIDQIWHMYASLHIESSNDTFETKVNASIPMTTVENMRLNLRLYERTLTLGSGANWGPAAADQDPYAFGKRFLSLKANIGSSAQNEWLRKMLQIWNLARLHNNLYDADHGVQSTVSNGDGGDFGYTQPGNEAPWDGSTVDPLQLEYYTIFGYGPDNTQLHNNAGFWTVSEEPAGTELYTGSSSTGYIEKVLLDKIHVHLRLKHFANDIRPSTLNSRDVLEQVGWVAFVENFFRYYMWSTNNAQVGTPATEEAAFVAKKVAFFNAYDASVAGGSQLLSTHIEVAANAAIGNTVTAAALTRALFQIKAYSSPDFWNAVMLKRLNHLPYHAVWYNTENMVAVDKGTPIEQSTSTLIATFNNMIDFYPKTVATDKQANSLLPDVFDWYKVVGYLAAVPQDLPDGEAAYNSDIGFGRISRATFPFVGTQTMSPQAFYEELTRRLFFMHKSSGLPVSGSLASDHIGASTFNVNEPGAVLGVYDQASDNYVSGFRGLKNLNNYYKLLRQENDLRLAQSNVNSETDLEDLERIFTNAISLLQAQKEALKDVTDTIGQDMIDLTNTLEAYHDPYQTSSTIRELQLRYVQLSSENRAQSVLEATYQAFAPLLTAVRTLSQSVSQKQIEYQNLLSAYNVRFEAYLSNYESWNTLIQRAEDLFGGATTYMNLLQGRLDLIASVGQLRAKFNADVSQVNSIVTSVQQTYLLLKSQGVRTIGNFATGSTFQLNGVTYSRPRAAIGSFSVENFLNFVPK